MFRYENRKVQIVIKSNIHFFKEKIKKKIDKMLVVFDYM